MEITNLAEILAIATVSIYILIFIIWQIKKNGLRKIAVSLIVYAEDNFRNNEDKFNYCVDQLIRNFIKPPFSFLITTDNVEKFVQSTFDLCKKALDYRKEN